MSAISRLRSLLWFLVAASYFYLAENVAIRVALTISSGEWLEVVNRTTLLFLLVAGYAAMGYVGQRQREPIRSMGLNFRPGWKREVALGAAIGWAGMVACVLPIALIGGLVITVYTTWHQFALILLDFAILAIAALSEEVAFRGYPFQRLIDAIGPTAATMLVAVIFGLIHLNNPGATGASTLVTMLAGWLLAVAYLRTRALWVAWGFHVAWNVVMGILFGLPISGITNFSPVISSNTIGPAWITGGDYGPEGSAVGAVVLLVLLFVMYVATGDLKHRYAQPVIIPGGMPVDIDAAARRQHEAAMGPAEPSAPQLVQIGGIASATLPRQAEINEEYPPQES
jgi:hypothetical protein